MRGRWGNPMWNIIPEPAGWPSIKTAYKNSLRQTLETVPSKILKADKLAAIDYWIARLLQDKNSVSLDQPFIPYP
jgi:hypothetical protein